MQVTNTLRRGFSRPFGSLGKSSFAGQSSMSIGNCASLVLPPSRCFTFTADTGLPRSTSSVKTSPMDLMSKHWFCTAPDTIDKTVVVEDVNGVEPPKKEDLEIKDSKVIFATVWNKLEATNNRRSLKFPKEIIWLGGAPGSGKGTNTPFIQRVRGITNPPIVMSEILDQDPTTRAIKDSGGLVTDRVVLELLLNKLLQEEYQNGVIVDGFPRTKIQVEFTKMLHDKMKELRKEFLNTDDGFKRPTFRVAVLYVEENESVERQLKRGHDAKLHNEKIQQTGHGTPKEFRPTDHSEDAARARYKIFKEHFSTLQTLREYFPFSLINANGSVSDVENSILKEFSYQSSLELASETFDAIQHIPLKHRHKNSGYAKHPSDDDDDSNNDDKSKQCVVARC